jgi:hypothetical protein
MNYTTKELKQIRDRAFNEGIFIAGALIVISIFLISVYNQVHADYSRSCEVNAEADTSTLFDGGEVSFASFVEGMVNRSVDQCIVDLREACAGMAGSSTVTDSDVICWTEGTTFKCFGNQSMFCEEHEIDWSLEWA